MDERVPSPPPKPKLSAKEEVAEVLLGFSKQAKDDGNPLEFMGDFGILMRGIELHQASSNGFDMICAVTHEESFSVEYKESKTSIATSLDVLECVTRGDHHDFVSYVDPMIELKKLYNLHSYQSEESRKKAAEFIEDRIEEIKRIGPDPLNIDHTEALRPKDPKSLAKILKKIKNTDVMSELEVELRSKLVQLQETYKSKQKELARMKSPKKKFKKRLPKKTTPKTGKGRQNQGSAKKKATSVTAPEVPPVLEPSSPQPPQLESWTKKLQGNGNNLLKPPKLTASLTPKSPTRPHSVTNLSTINERFMKGKANPFANLLAKLTTPGPSASGSAGSNTKMDDIDEEDEETASTSSGKENTTAKESTTTEEEEEEESEVEAESDESEDLEDCYTAKSVASGGKRDRSSSLDFDSSASTSKKRKAEKPKKSAGTTETIVPKKPKNLFMMNHYEFETGFLGSKDSGSSDDLPPPPEATSSPKKKEFPSTKPQSTQKSPKKQQQSKTSNNSSSSLPTASNSKSDPPLRSARLNENDLVDGLKLLILQEGRFWPARLNSTQLPDVYGIVMEKQRGNRPQILPRDDILREAVSVSIDFTEKMESRQIFFIFRFLKSNRPTKSRCQSGRECASTGAEPTIACFPEPLRSLTMSSLTRTTWFKSCSTMVIVAKLILPASGFSRQTTRTSTTIRTRSPLFENVEYRPIASTPDRVVPGKQCTR